MRRHVGPLGAVLALALELACTGHIGSADEGRRGGPGRDGGAAGAGGGAGGARDAGPGAIPPHGFTTGPGLRRLTRTEYANTVFDLLGVAVDREDVPRELIVDGHGQIAGAQKTGYGDSDVFVELGDKVAAQAAVTVSGQVACSDAACYRRWTQGFLLRAFREPPSAALLDRYGAIWTSVEAGETQADRILTFLTAVLSSPQFLYRKEIGTPVAGDPTVRNLGAYEIASRLSYLIWQSAPDPALADAAASSRLLDPAGRLAELERMLGSDRARRGLRGFVSDWMELHENNLAKKIPEVLAGTGTDFPNDAERGFAMLVDDVLAGGTSSRFTDLLTVEHAFGNGPLAKVMGARESPTAFQRVTVDPSQRRGILTQPLVIGAHSKESGSSPFPIGKFVYQNVLCEEIPPPPAVFPPIEDSAGDKSLRERLEDMTRNEPCISCHIRIGPPGFAFLPYDPVGRYSRTDAAGRPFDTRGALKLAGQDTPVPFDGASDLSAKLAAQPGVQRCVGTRMFRWAYGRFESERDRAALDGAGKAAVDSASGVAAVLREVVSSAEFSRVRIREEAP